MWWVVLGIAALAVSANKGRPVASFHACRGGEPYAINVAGGYANHTHPVSAVLTPADLESTAGGAVRFMLDRVDVQGHRNHDHAVDLTPAQVRTLLTFGQVDAVSRPGRTQWVDVGGTGQYGDDPHTHKVRLRCQR